MSEIDLSRRRLLFTGFLAASSIQHEPLLLDQTISTIITAASFLESTMSQQVQPWRYMDFNHPSGPWRYVESEFDPLERQLWSRQSLRLWSPIIAQSGIPTIEGPMRDLDRIYQIITSEPGKAWELEKPGHDAMRASGRMDLGGCFDLAKLVLQRPEPTPHFEPELNETISLVNKVGWLTKLHASDGWMLLSRQNARNFLDSGEPVITRRYENGQVWERLIIATSGNRVLVTNFGAEPISVDFDRIGDLIGFYTPIYMYGNRGYEGIKPTRVGAGNDFVVEQRRLILRLSYPQLYNFAPLEDFVN